MRSSFGIRPLLAAGAVLLLAGCYWLRYDALARTHVELLRGMAQKLADVTGIDGTPPAALAEYRYPLERARDFARIVAGRADGRESFRAFGELCDAYDRMLGAAEALRVDPVAPGRRDTLREAVERVHALGVGTLAALDRESGI
jgi:hypothetical protein